VEILLIEDDQVDIKMVRRAFQTLAIPHALRVVDSAIEALEVLQRKDPSAGPEAVPRPDLMLLDLNMPGMGGLEFLSVVKADSDLKNIPVIVLSTSDLQSDIRTSFDRGVAGYFIKPLEYTQFVETLKSILNYWELCEHPQDRPAMRS
jgi:hypothetical protein